MTFNTTDPEVAALVANRAVELYLEREVLEQRERHDRFVERIADRIPVARDKLERAESALRAHRIRYGLGDDTGTDVIDRQIGELTRQLMIARSELDARDIQLGRLRAASLGGVPDDRQASKHRGEADLRIAAVSPPDLVGDGGLGAGPLLAPEIAAPDAALERAASERDVVAERLSNIEARLETLQEASTKSTGSWTRLRELEREAGAAGQSYESLLRRYADLQSEGAAHPSARLITTAAVPEGPSTPDPRLFVAPALVASLVLAGVLAILLERLDQRLRGERDVELAVGAPCIGLVPRIARPRGPGLRKRLHEQPFSPFTEAIRSVFVAARQRQPDARHAQRLLVTSCAQGDGATTLVSGLAIYAAQLGQRVLIVDFDLRRPGLLRRLGVSGGAAAEVTLPRGPAGFAVRTASEYGIDYLTLPAERVDPLRLLSGDEFPALLAGLQESYDCILIDSAPVATATETRLLASLVDHVILTVRWGVTDARAALAALHQLQAGGAQDAAPISVVVSQVKWRVHRRHRYSQVGPAPAGLQGRPA